MMDWGKRQEEIVNDINAGGNLYIIANNLITQEKQMLSEFAEKIKEKISFSYPKKYPKELKKLCDALNLIMLNDIDKLLSEYKD